MTLETTQTTLRPLLADDAATVAEIFRDAVLNGTRSHYTEEERHRLGRAQARPRALARPRRQLGGADGRARRCARRADDPRGARSYRPRLRAPLGRGQGIGAELLAALTPIARASGARSLTADVSKAARPFFERHGFYVLRQQSVIRRGVALINYAMQKPL